jgi:hypothetical protein
VPRHTVHILNIAVRITPLAKHTQHCCDMGMRPNQCRVSSRPMLEAAGAGLPTGMDGLGSCPTHTNISLIRVSRKSLCEIFFHHMKIRGCNCWEWPGLIGGKRASLSTSMCNGWPYSYWPSYLHCQHTHVIFIICHNCQLYRVPVFIMISAVC